ncbi:hypothetical protein [Caballeronia hypogeia]|uniref:hypothetical protein n=1 Tax=Caballeronia hypogeia TaxID=1777140 RepID=UPI00077233E0|nr:hypothetical protein [Caballeronia hypogeia]
MNELEAVCLVLGVLLTSTLLIAWPLVAHVAAGNLSAETREMWFQLIAGLAPVGILSFTVDIATARLQSCEKQIHTLIECMPALVLLCFILAMPHHDSLRPLMPGISVGVALQAILLRVLARKADGKRVRPWCSFRSPHWGKTLRSIGMLAFGGIIVSMITPLDQYFLVHAETEPLQRTATRIAF